MIGYLAQLALGAVFGWTAVTTYRHAREIKRLREDHQRLVEILGKIAAAAADRIREREDGR